MSMRGGERDRCSIVGRENGSFWILGELGGHCCNVTIDVAVVGHYLIFFLTLIEALNLYWPLNRIAICRC